MGYTVRLSENTINKEDSVHRIIALAYTMLAVTALGTTTLAYATEVELSLRMYLKCNAQKLIYFGHQSVVENLLDGMQQISTIASVPIRVFETPMANDVKATGLGHIFVTRNGEPLFDLTSVKSTTLVESAVTGEWKGSVAPAMAPAYTRTDT